MYGDLSVARLTLLLLMAASTLGGCAPNSQLNRDTQPGWTGCRAGTVLLCKGNDCRCTDKHTVQDLLF